MDAVGLAILKQEIEADCAVIRDAALKASLRLRDGTPGNLEACAYELARLYNVFEKILERLCRGFENHFDRRDDYHERLIQRLALALPGIRPAFIPKDELRHVRELKGFRHLVRHAYDLEFRPDRMQELVAIGALISSRLPGWAREFTQHIAAEQGWN